MKAIYGVSILCMSIGLFCAGSICAAQAKASNSAATVTVPADAVRIGREQIRSAKWPRALLMEPSDEGQFEILVSKSALPDIQAPSCRQDFLLVRMPGVRYSDPAFAAKVKARKDAYARLADLSRANSPIPLHLEASGYGKVDLQGKLQLTGCNLWFTEP